MHEATFSYVTEHFFLTEDDTFNRKDCLCTSTCSWLPNRGFYLTYNRKSSKSQLLSAKREKQGLKNGELSQIKRYTSLCKKCRKALFSRTQEYPSVWVGITLINYHKYCTPFIEAR